MGDSIVRSQPPLVGVVIPTLNGEKYVARAIQSLRSQTIMDWVCVVIDNASSDHTGEEILAAIDDDTRFKVVTNRTCLPQAENWNKGICELPEDIKYLKVLCDDDWLYPEYFAEKIPVLEGSADVGICSSFRIDGDSIGGLGLKYDEGPVYQGKEILVRTLLGELEVFGSPSTVFYSVEWLQKIGRYPEVFDGSVPHFDTVLAIDLVAVSNLGFVWKVLSYTDRNDQTVTATIANRFRSHYCYRVIMLRRYSQLDIRLVRFEKELRRRYLRFLLLARVRGDIRTIEWHKRECPLSFGNLEMIRALNVFGYLFRWLCTKVCKMV